MATGTNLNSATSPSNTTLWLRELEPSPTGTNDVQLAISAACTGTPPTTANVFKNGCIMTKLDAVSGNALYENTGTSASPVWTLIAAPAPGTIALTNTHIFVGNASNLATDVAMSGDATMANTGALTIANNAITTAKINAAAVTLAKLAAGVAPFSINKFDAQYTTVGGGAAEAITITGALATDRAYVQLVNAGTNNVSVVKAVLTSNTLTVTFSGDPGNNAVINYLITRTAT